MAVSLLHRDSLFAPATRVFGIIADTGTVVIRYVTLRDIDRKRIDRYRLPYNFKRNLPMRIASLAKNNKGEVLVHQVSQCQVGSTPSLSLGYIIIENPALVSTALPLF